jgi:hypothetical protein
MAGKPIVAAAAVPAAAPLRNLRRDAPFCSWGAVLFLILFLMGCVSEVAVSVREQTAAIWCCFQLSFSLLSALYAIRTTAVHKE